MKKPVEVKVVQSKEAPVERSVLAQAIVDISAAMRNLNTTGLNRDAIILLVHSRCKHRHGQRPTQGTIRDVFDAVQQLHREFVTK